MRLLAGRANYQASSGQDARPAGPTGPAVRPTTSGVLPRAQQMSRHERLQMAASPTAWGIEDPDDPTNAPWTRVLDEISELGVSWTELGPIGYVPGSPRCVAEQFSRRGLRVAGSYVLCDFETPGAEERHRAAVDAVAQVLNHLGAPFLVLINAVSAERGASCGRTHSARRLTGREWDRFVEQIHRVAVLAADDYGLEAVFHPHAGTFVEFEDEIHRLVDCMGPDLGLCLDTGHLTVAGMDPADCIRRWSSKLAYIHLKDVDPRVLEFARDHELGFVPAMHRHLFTPIGDGGVSFSEVLAALNDAGYSGPVTVEQDRHPSGASSALADAQASFGYLRALGFG
jgi:inosose dehydratase